MRRSWVVTAAVIVAAAMLGLGAGVTTALFSRDDAGTPSSGRSTTGAPTTPGDATGATTAPAPSDALYYADGTIHDGTTEVAYQPRFQATVADVSRTDDGWVVKERFGQDGSRLVLVGPDGATTPVQITDPHWYDVSPAGNALAVPDDDLTKIDFVDTGDGTVISTLASGLGGRVVNARFTGAGDDLVVLGSDGKARGSTLAVYHTDSDAFEELQRPPGGATSTLVGADDQGTHVLLEYFRASKPCVAVLDLTDDGRSLWKSCRYRPLGSDAVSPDGDSVALAASSAPIGTVTDLSIVSAGTGDRSASVRISSGFRLIDATWSDSAHLVVQGANDAFTGETIDLCSVAAGCDSVPDASPDRPADDVAPGS
jgi:hypothetical protein